jgi:hypothetical protein
MGSSRARTETGLATRVKFPQDFFERGLVLLGRNSEILSAGFLQKIVKDPSLFGVHRTHFRHARVVDSGKRQQTLGRLGGMGTEQPVGLGERADDWSTFGGGRAAEVAQDGVDFGAIGGQGADRVGGGRISCEE